LLNFAIGSENKESKLYSSIYERGFGLYTLNKNTTDHKDFQIVKERTFDELFRDLKHIDLIKIDVEGFEYEVLKGMSHFLRDNKIDNIILEANNNNVLKLLKSYGYKLNKIDGVNYLATKINSNTARF